MDPYSSPRKDNGVDTNPVALTGFTTILPGAAPVVISMPGLFESTVIFDVKLFGDVYNIFLMFKIDGDV